MSRKPKLNPCPLCLSTDVVEVAIDEALVCPVLKDKTAMRCNHCGCTAGLRAWQLPRFGAMRLAEYDKRLSAVVPKDLKCWHKGNPDEWPWIAAELLKNLRRSNDQGWSAADAALKTIDKLDARIKELEAERAPFKG